MVKDKGGLGITKLADTNFSRLWRLCAALNALWKKMISAKYNQSFISEIRSAGK